MRHTSSSKCIESSNRWIKNAFSPGQISNNKKNRWQFRTFNYPRLEINGADCATNMNSCMRYELNYIHNYVQVQYGWFKKASVSVEYLWINANFKLILKYFWSVMFEWINKDFRTHKTDFSIFVVYRLSHSVLRTWGKAYQLHETTKTKCRFTYTLMTRTMSAWNFGIVILGISYISTANDSLVIPFVLSLWMLLWGASIHIRDCEISSRNKDSSKLAVPFRSLEETWALVRPSKSYCNKHRSAAIRRAFSNNPVPILSSTFEVLLQDWVNSKPNVVLVE